MKWAGAEAKAPDGTGSFVCDLEKVRAQRAPCFSFGPTAVEHAGATNCPYVRSRTFAHAS